MKNTWKKKEHLKSRKAIDMLFKEGEKVKKFPIRLIYKLKPTIDTHRLDQINGTQAGFSVPKKLHKKAVARNRIKRQMREAYRMNKHLAPPSHYLFFIYYAKESLSFAEIESSIKSLLSNIKG